MSLSVSSMVGMDGVVVKKKEGIPVTRIHFILGQISGVDIKEVEWGEKGLLSVCHEDTRFICF